VQSSIAIEGQRDGWYQATVKALTESLCNVDHFGPIPSKSVEVQCEEYSNRMDRIDKIKAD
jgi:hypothetical protein